MEGGNNPGGLFARANEHKMIRNDEVRAREKEPEYGTLGGRRLSSWKCRQKFTCNTREKSYLRKKAETWSVKPEPDRGEEDVIQRVNKV